MGLFATVDRDGGREDGAGLAGQQAWQDGGWLVPWEPGPCSALGTTTHLPARLAPAQQLGNCKSRASAQATSHRLPIGIAIFRPPATKNRRATADWMQVRKNRAHWHIDFTASNVYRHGVGVTCAHRTLPRLRIESLAREPCPNGTVALPDLDRSHRPQAADVPPPPRLASPRLNLCLLHCWLFPPVTAPSLPTLSWGARAVGHIARIGSSRVSAAPRRVSYQIRSAGAVPFFFFIGRLGNVGQGETVHCPPPTAHTCHTATATAHCPACNKLNLDGRPQQP